MDSNIEEYAQKALDNYNTNIASITNIMEQEDLMKKLYILKSESIKMFNQVFDNNDIFNNPDQTKLYNSAKANLEQEISEAESKILDHNASRSTKLCSELLDLGYKNIKEKMSQGYYTSKTCEEYAKDFESFLKTYTEQAKGPDKIGVLLNFLSEEKPGFIKYFSEVVEAENKLRLEDASRQLLESNQLKQESEEKMRQLTEVADKNDKKINDMNSEIEKKKREIIELSEKISKIEGEIRAKREEGININEPSSKNLNK